MAGRWEGTGNYIASDALERIVNVAVSLERPLLIKGEPGTGKTLLAHSIAEGLGLKLFTWHVKSTTKARDGLYIYDAVQRLYDSRFQDKDVSDIRQYITLGPLGRALTSEQQVVLLIDEIGYFDDAVRVLSDQAGISRPGVFQYRKGKGFRDIFGWMALNVKPRTFMDILEREKNIRSYGMYYLWDGASLINN